MNDEQTQPGLLLEPGAAPALLRALDAASTALTQQAAALLRALAAAGNGDPRGHLRAGSAAGLRAATQTLGAHARLEELLGNAGATLRSIRQADQELAMGGALAAARVLASAPPSTLPALLGRTPTIEQRARLLFERLADDGLPGWLGIGALPTTFQAIEPALRGISPAEWRALQRLYLREYSSRRGGLDLLDDLLGELAGAGERYQLSQLVAHDSITRQPYDLPSPDGPAYISSSWPLRSLVTGSTATYRIDGVGAPGSLGESDSEPMPWIESAVIDNASGEIVDGGVGTILRTAFIRPGSYTVVFELQRPGERPRYTSYQQLVLPASEVAQQTLAALGDRTLSAEGYLKLRERQLEQLRETGIVGASGLARAERALAEAHALLKAPAYPLPAVLIVEEGAQPIALALYLRRVEHSWEIVDLSNSMQAQRYHGATIEGAWRDFIEDNSLPKGQIAARVPLLPSHGQHDTPAHGPPQIWNEHSDGATSLERWIDGLSLLSLGAGLLGAGLLLLPGGQVAGGALLAFESMSLATGLAASGLRLYDLQQHGALTVEAAGGIALLDLAALLVGSGALLARGQRALQQSGGLVQIGELLELGIRSSKQLLLAREHYLQIEQIRSSGMSRAEQSAAIATLIARAWLSGGLVFVGMEIMEARKAAMEK